MRSGELDDRDAIEVGRADRRGARARARPRDRPPRREAVERPARRAGRAIDVRLLDFGLAQMAEFDTLTALGDIPGTLAYISPERLQGLTATPAADVWAVGVLLWEALAGEHPFWGGDLVETSRRIQHGAPPLDDAAPRPAAASARDGRERAARQPAAPPVGRAPRPRAALAAEAAPPQAGRLDARRRRSRPRERRASPSALLPAALAGLASGWVAATPARSTRRLAGSGSPRPGAALGFAAPRAGPRSSRSRSRSSRSPTSRSGSRSSMPALAVAWLALTWRDARAGLLLAVGPLLAPSPRSRCSRSPPSSRAAGPAARLQAGAAVLLAAARRRAAPRARCRSTARRRRSGSAIAGSDRPGAVADALWRAARSPSRRCSPRRSSSPPRPRSCPYVRRRGPWAAALFGAALLAATALLAPAAAVLPLVAAAWLTAAALAVEPQAVDSAPPGNGPGLAMSVLRSIESKLESLFEGVFGRAFRTNVQPVELARKLVKEMDDHRNVSVSRVYVPNEYTIYLSPGDREQFASYEAAARGRARRLPHRARAPRELRAAHAAGREARDRRRPRRRRLRHRDAHGADGAPKAASPPAQAAPGATMIYKPTAPACSRPRPRRPSSSASSARSPSSPGTGSATSSRSARVVIGRSKDADIQVADPNVSRRHAELRQEGADLLARRPRLDERRRGERQAREAAEARGRHALHDRLDRARPSPGAAVALLASAQVETTLLVLKIAFLVLLYLFIWRIVRSAARDLRLPQESMILGPQQAAAAGLRPAAAGARDSAGSSCCTSPALDAGDVFALDSQPLTVGRGGDERHRRCRATSSRRPATRASSRAATASTSRTSARRTARS